MTDLSLSRRKFLKTTGAGLLALASPGLAFSKVQAIGDPLQEYAYTGWEDLHRKEWTWDRAQYCTHSVGCVGKCSWKGYSKDGIPMREAQKATYPIYGRHTPGKYTW